MNRRPLAPLRGLLAGLLALIAFAAVAVAMTAGGSRAAAGTLTPPATAQTVVQGGHARIALRDSDAHDGVSSGDHHR
jgi:hypothetical protein